MYRVFVDNGEDSQFSLLGRYIDILVQALVQSDNSIDSRVILLSNKCITITQSFCIPITTCQWITTPVGIRSPVTLPQHMNNRHNQNRALSSSSQACGLVLMGRTSKAAISAQQPPMQPSRSLLFPSHLYLDNHIALYPISPYYYQSIYS